MTDDYTENLQASKAKLHDLPTRDEVADMCHRAISPHDYKHFPYVFKQEGKDVADALIKRGWLRVKE